MSNTKKTFYGTKRIEEEGTHPRRSYRKPHLEELGDLRTLTLGGSPGTGDSGGGDPEFPRGSPGGPLMPPGF